jgi:hypothetical protein
LVKKLLPVPFSPVSTVRGRTFTVPPLNLPKFLTLISNNSVFSIVNKNLLYIDATNNIQVSGAIIDAFDQSLTRKGEEDKKNIQLD